MFKQSVGDQVVVILRVTRSRIPATPVKYIGTVVVSQKNRIKVNFNGQSVFFYRTDGSYAENKAHFHLRLSDDSVADVKAEKEHLALVDKLLALSKQVAKSNFPPHTRDDVFNAVSVLSKLLA